MPLAVFGETLRRGWRGMVYWGIGLGLLGVAMMVIIPNVNFLKQFENLLNTMPAVVKALGMEDAAQMATPEGFISAGYFGRVLLIIAVYAVLAGLNITVNDEDQGIMDMVLSLPLARWRLIIEKFAAYSLMMTGVILMGFIGLYVGGMSSTIQISTGSLIAGSINVLPSSLFMLAFTLFAGVLFRRKTMATAVTATFILGSYIVDFAGNAASESPIAPLRVLSFFTYYDNAHILQKGLNSSYIVLLLGLTVVLVGASVWVFQRRDIGV